MVIVLGMNIGCREKECTDFWRYDLMENSHFKG
jgi:hypothetical protein